MAKPDLNLKRFVDPTEQSEIQSIALIQDVTTNPIFAAPVIASGEDFSTPVEGVTLEEAQQSVPLETPDQLIGPVIINGTNTQQVIDVLASDIQANFIGNAIQDKDDITRFFTGAPVVQELRKSLDVCVLDSTNEPLTDKPTEAYDQSAVNAAVIAGLGHPVFNVFGGRNNLAPNWSSGEPSIPNAILGSNHPAKVLAINLYNVALNNALQSNPPQKTCPSGSTYFEIFEVSKFRFSKPYQLQANVTITGLNYTADDGTTGIIIDDTIPTPFTTTYLYTGGEEYEALNNILSEAGKTAISGKSFDISVRYYGLGSAGEIGPPTTDEKNVIGAINELDLGVNAAANAASTVESSVWVSGVGDWRNSQVLEIDDPNDTTGATMINPNFDQISYDALTGINPEWNNQIAWRKLNLIPVLLKDKILVAKEYADPDDETATITRLELDQNSQVNLLEATFSLWRHISADTTNTYGISALTDPDLQPDQLIEPLSSHSFINIFNSLYTDLSGLSADLSTHKFAISGDSDLLIESLSGNSIYTNLNNIYTGLSALSAQDFDVACCDVLQLSALELSAQTTTLSSDLHALSGYVMDLDLTGGGSGGTTELPCDDICEGIDGLKKTIISTEHPGGFDIPFPSLDDNGDPRPYTPDGKIPTEGGPAGVEPGSVVYKTIIDKKEYIIYKKQDGGWTADGPFDDDTPRHYDGPGVTITGGDDHGPAGGTLPDPFPQQPPITERPDPFPEWKDKLVEIREIKERIGDLEECCDDFQRFKRGMGDLADPAAPVGFKIPPIDPTTGNTPTGWGLPPANPEDPHVPIIPTTGGGIIVPDPTGGGTTTYTPVPPDAADFPPAAKPGTVVYKTIINGETKYIYKDRTINKWIHTGTPGDPTAPDWKPLDEPPQIDPNPIIPDDTTGGVIADYPTTGAGKPYLPVPDGDPKPTNADPAAPVYKYIDNSTNTTRYIYKDVITNRWIVTNGDPDDPTIQPPATPLDEPDPHTIIKTIRDEFTECCEEFKDFLDKYNENPPPAEYEIPDFTPDNPDGPETPWYHPLPDDPTGPVIMPVDDPTGGIAVPGPEADDPKVYTPVPPDDPNRPPAGGVKPGTIIYKYITQAGETKYIYKHITTNKWIKGDNPDDPNDPTGTPLGDPPDNTGGVINRRPDGGVDVPYPPTGPAKPYQPIPQDDPGRPVNVCEGSVVYKHIDPATNVELFVYCDVVTGKWMVGGNPDTPGSPKIPLDPPTGGDTTINSLSALVENNIIQIDGLSGCCTDNKTALSALSAAIYGAGPEPDVFIDDLTGSIIFNINTLYEMILGGGTGSETDSLQVTINKTNISSLSADFESLSADVVALSACCDINRFNIDLNNTTLTDRITAIETEIDALDDMFVDRTDHQTISGEKVFEDDFTVSAPADFGDNVTIGVGETIFKACTLTNGMTQIQIPRLPEEGVDDLNDLPIDSLYITDINGTKVLAIKAS